MKTLFASEDRQVQVAAADLAIHITALFAACPNLCGFVVEDLGESGGPAELDQDEERLVITQISFGGPCSGDESQQICSLIVNAVSELVTEQPETYELMRGRTFARTLH